MTESERHDTAARRDAPRTGYPRRDFLRLLPLGLLAGVAATVLSAAYRFLRPADGGAGGDWAQVAPVSALTGGEPITRKLLLTRETGWAREQEARTVFVLPQAAPRVLDAACPHEGCEVVWRGDERKFFCPCHDSRFTPDGERVDGPAARGLYELPARVENGVLEIRFDLAAERARRDERV